MILPTVISIESIKALRLNRDKTKKDIEEKVLDNIRRLYLNKRTVAPAMFDQ
jgi:hypothetical protein